MRNESYKAFQSFYYCLFYLIGLFERITEIMKEFVLIISFGIKTIVNAKTQVASFK